jgi:sortase A
MNEVNQIPGQNPGQSRGQNSGQSRRSKLVSRQAAQQAKKQAKEAARFRKHGPKAKTSFIRNVIPALAGISVMLVILTALNGQWIEAQYKYRFNKPVAAATIKAPNPASSTTPAVDTRSPHPELGPQLNIPSINIQAPVEFDKGTAEWQIQIALRSGVDHYDNSAKPGQAGNVVIFGHSSGQLWAPGNYKFIFTLLNKVAVNDAVYVDYNGTRYTYKVVSTEVVAPTDTAILQQGNGNGLTLITCTPVGTSKNRLVVHAEQISPAPTKATSGAAKSTPASLKELPGSAQ